jgi:hypothetical protein
VGVCMCGFCNIWVCVCVGFVMCGCFGNMCTCIYCVLYCLYCVFVLVRLCIFILICFVCTGVRTGGTLLVAQSVEALRHKPEGRGFDSPWCHREFFIDTIHPAALWPWG